MNTASFNRQFLLTAGLLLASLFLFEFTNIDLVVQDHLYYQQSHQWMIDAKDPFWRFLLYDGMKSALIILGSSLLIGYLVSFRFAALRSVRSRILLLLLSLAFVPLIIAGLKDYTNVYCPAQLQRYGGDKPYVKVFEPYPQGFTQKDRGRCFPAGHASGGFSLLALYFIPQNRRAKQFALITGVSVGWAMGFYQMAKGAHFLSHTVVSMLGAWLIILVIYRFLGGDNNETQASIQSIS